jgi:hypothetical protein
MLRCTGGVRSGSSAPNRMGLGHVRKSSNRVGPGAGRFRREGPKPAILAPVRGPRIELPLMLSGGCAMKLRRRQFLHLAAGAATLPLLSRVASAQAYPTRPVRIIVAAAAGGPTDIAARLIGQRSPSGSAGRSSSRTGRGETTISAPRRSCARPPTAIRC